MYTITYLPKIVTATLDNRSQMEVGPAVAWNLTLTGLKVAVTNSELQMHIVRLKQ
jgi:hypothetical protein